MASGIALLLISACFLAAYWLYCPDEPWWFNALGMLICSAGFVVCIVTGMGRIVL